VGHCPVCESWELGSTCPCCTTTSFSSVTNGRSTCILSISDRSPTVAAQGGRPCPSLTVFKSKELHLHYCHQTILQNMSVTSLNPTPYTVESALNCHLSYWQFCEQCHSLTHTIIKHITTNNHPNLSLHTMSSTIQTTYQSMNGSHFHRNREDVTNHSSYVYRSKIKDKIMNCFYNPPVFSGQPRGNLTMTLFCEIRIMGLSDGE